MLIYNSKLINTPVLSVQAGGVIAFLDKPIIDPDSLKILAFFVTGPMIQSSENILDVKSIREYSHLGVVIDEIEELVGEEDVVKIKKVLELNFDLIGLSVETKKGTKLGKIIDFTTTSEDFVIKQLVVKRPLIKSLTDSELIIPRSEVVEITDYKIIVKDEEKTIKARAKKEDFIPNFVNPFREPGFAPAQTENPVEQDKQ